ncbi:MAG: biotin synthase, partial [Ruminococcaceae bacterium]|nr:biotin synthase [Oscillospiraceae bacterium]
FSAYMPVSDSALLPSTDTKPPLLREHRLYQADWLLRFYGFTANEILDPGHQSFNPYIDPKCNWALNHMECFPMEINRAPYAELLRVPGIGVTSAKRIVTARRTGPLNFDGLKKLGVVLKRAQYFITCGGKIADGLKITQDAALRSLMSDTALGMYQQGAGFAPEQLSLFEQPRLTQEDVRKCLTGQI